MKNKIQSNYDDGAGGSGGSSWSKVLKITGIGCAILVLVGALLTGLGVFKAATCCSQFEDLAAHAEEVQVVGHEFATAVHAGNFEEAYGYLSESARQEISKEEFTAEFEQWQPMLTASKPFPMRLDVDIEDDEDVDWSELTSFDRWAVSTYFSEPRSEEVLELDFIVATEQQDDETATHGVDSWNVEQRQRRLSQDVYGQTALQFHDRIDRKNFADARNMIDSEITWSEDGAGLRDGVEDLADQLPPRTSVDVYGLYPEDDAQLVSVRLLLTDADDNTYFVDYVVTWEETIYAISELQSVDLEPEAVDDSDDADNADDDDDDDDDEAAGEGDDQQEAEDADDSDDADADDDQE